ncbi:hypothetical protein CDD83_1980 [Cordyceps sp. RAO-2017]|nr:hypothetical protein CDD83_1980 [Cordyceps sp. RAO-2017]
MASESEIKMVDEPLNEDLNFDDGIAPTATVWLKWDVKGGRDRKHDAYLDTNYTLDGTPNIQGLEIKSSMSVRVLCWASRPNGDPDQEVDGPTGGKQKFGPKRLGSYRVVTR